MLNTATADELERQNQTGLMPNQRFFKGGHWGQCLELLQHLCLYSDHTLLVTGQKGIGKTVLSKALIASSSGQLKICLLDGVVIRDVAVMMKLIAEAFHLPWDQEASQSRVLQSHQFSPKDEPWAILVDNAESLPEQLLESLLLLSKTNEQIAKKLRLVFFSETDLAKVFPRVWLKDVVQKIHHLEIEPLTLSETEAFLNFDWQVAGQTGPLPIDGVTIKKIYLLSTGVPGKIKSLVETLLSGEPLEKKANGIKIKRIFSPVTLGLLIILGLLYIMISIISNPEKNFLELKKKISEQIEPETTGVEATISNSEVKDIKQLILEQDNQEKDSQEVASIADEIEAAQIEQTPKRQPEEVDQPIVLQAEVKEEKINSVETKQREMVQATTTEAEPINDELKEQTEALKKQALLEELAKKAAAQKEAELVKQDMLKKQSILVQDNNPKIEQQVPTRSLNNHSYNALDQKILNKAKDHFTLQLVGASREDAMKKMIQRYQLKDAYTVKTTLKGKPWYVLIYGDFTSRQAALNAIGKLPQEIRKLSPWPRSFGSVQSSIRKRG